MLSDTAWLHVYFATMTSRLRASYELCVSFLKELEINYIPAYVFLNPSLVWV